MTRSLPVLTVCALTSIAVSLGGQQAGQSSPKTHHLKATPKTVAWGYYDAKSTPVLHINSGDIVEVHTLITNSPQGLERAFVPPDQVEQALRDIHKEVKSKGPGG